MLSLFSARFFAFSFCSSKVLLHADTMSMISSLYFRQSPKLPLQVFSAVAIAFDSSAKLHFLNIAAWSSNVWLAKQSQMLSPVFFMQPAVPATLSSNSVIMALHLSTSVMLITGFDDSLHDSLMSTEQLVKIEVRLFI